MKNGLGNVGCLAMDLLYDLMGGTYDDAIRSTALHTVCMRCGSQCGCCPLASVVLAKGSEGGIQAVPLRRIDTPQSKTRTQVVSTEAGKCPTKLGDYLASYEAA